MDFDDLLALPVAIFREHPQELQRWRRQFTQVLVDEFQDTSAVQFEFIHMLAAEHRSLFVVGDPNPTPNPIPNLGFGFGLTLGR